jgi:hypothetical protein
MIAHNKLEYVVLFMQMNFLDGKSFNLELMDLLLAHLILSLPFQGSAFYFSH